MKRIGIARENGVVVVTGENGHWHADEALTDTHPMCLAVDPRRPERWYCGTFGNGVWRSDDAGASWQPVGDGITESQIMSVAVSSTEDVVYAGSEPSALFRSENGGDTWRECETLRALPSAPTWSFPPRPYTSHVRAIAPDPNVPSRIFVCIEAGALVWSTDGGATWTDRTADGPWDTHTLRMHPNAPNRLYSAAGDGFMRSGRGYSESYDAGQTWQRPDDGLRHHYLWGEAVHPTDPDTVIISAASSPNNAHNPTNAEAHVYRRTGGGAWQEVAGLPDPRGSLAASLVADTDEPGTFYAALNTGLFRSDDAGAHWQPVEIPWRDRFSHIGDIAVAAV